MILRALLAAVLAGLALLLPAAALAQSVTLQCWPREPLFDRRAAAFGEVPAFLAVTRDGELFEVLVAPDGSWSAFLTFPDGYSCPLAHGEGWQQRRPPPRGLDH